MVNQENAILIRLQNDSPYDLSNVVVTSSGSGPVRFGNLPAHQLSPYKEFKSAYPTAAVSATINSDSVQFLPDDYIGEHALDPGRYTYRITVDTKKNLRLTFVKP